MIQLKKMEIAIEVAENLSENPNITFIPKGGNILIGL